jgi:hypothetical protein
MIPSIPPEGCRSRGEFDLWLRLRDDSATKDWIVLHSLDIANHVQKVCGELDFVVIIPQLGVICVEVKACCRLHRDQAGWYYGEDTKPDVRGPFKQASQGMHSLMNAVLPGHPELRRVVFWSAVIFPYVAFRETSIEWHSWQVIDSVLYRSQPISSLLRGVLTQAREHLSNSTGATWFTPESLLPTQQQCDELAMLLRPEFEIFELPSSRRDRLNKELKQFTDEQLGALSTMDDNLRVVFQGAAGTGKTVLAIEAARRSVSVGRRVLFLCFNRLLGEWLRTEAVAVGANLQCLTIHKYMLEITRDVPPMNANSDYWQTKLPELAVDAILSDEFTGVAFDELIIDEAQDILRPGYLDVLDLSIKGGLAAGRWRMFGDVENQAIYSDGVGDRIGLKEFCNLRGGHPVLYNLRINCRNTPRIASWAEILGRLSPGYERVRRSDDRVEPRIEPYTTADKQREVLIRTLESLYDEGYKGHDIVILSTHSGDAALASTVTEQPWNGRLKAYSSSDQFSVRYCSIHAFKGLEASAVIVTDVDSYDERTIALLFIATTRALNRLTVLVNKQAHKQVVDYILREI